MNLQPTLIAILIGIIVGIMSYRVISAIDRQWRGRSRANDISPYKRVEIIIELVRVPQWVQRTWATGETKQLLRHSGIPWRTETFVALRWLIFLLGVIGGLVLAAWHTWNLLGVSMGVLLMIGGWLGPEAWLRLRIERRQNELDLALPDFLDRMALGLKAGLAFQIALQRTAERFPGFLGMELRRLVRQLERGHHRGWALEELAERTPSQDLQAFAVAVKQSERLGTSLAQTFRVQTRLLRARRRRRAQDASRRLPILIVFPLVLFFLPSLLIIYLAPPLLHLFLGR